MKKITSTLFIIFAAFLLTTTLSYVRAAYVEPAGSPVGNNTPAPILLGDSTGFIGFGKVGRLGVTTDKSAAPVESAAFTDNVLVVSGQMATDSLAVNGTMRILAELETNSNLKALFVGDPTQNSFMQTNPDASPKTFLVKSHTRAPRAVIGSKGAPANAYNLYLTEGSNATNLGKNNDYCTLTKSQLQNSGCPVGYAYRGVQVATYLGQVIVTSSSSNNDVVAACYILTPTASPTNLGACY